MKNKQVFYWVIDILILASLVLEYKLDWTGLQIHELLGLAVFAIMLIHLIVHWRWVFTVMEKVFESVSSKATFCFVINAGLLFLFSGIVITGLIISSLLNLPLAGQSYEFWRFLHVSVSYLTLVVVGLKLAVHWKWIVSTTKRKIFNRNNKVPAMAAKANASGVSRRQFLAQTCVFSGAMVIAGVSYVAWMKKNLFVDDTTVQAAESLEEAVTATPHIVFVTATPEQQVEEAAVENAQPLVQPTEVPTVATAIPTVTAANVRPAGAASSQLSNTTSVRCNRGCSYPGHCRRYEDTNGNNRCDLSEW